MASGTIYGYTSNPNIECKIEWSSVADAVKNESTVTAALYYRRTDTGYKTYGPGEFTIRVDFIEVASDYNKYIEIGTSWVKVIEGSRKVSHQEYGEKSVVIDVWEGNIPSTTLEYTRCSGTVTLDTILKESKILSSFCSTAFFTGEIKYTYNVGSLGTYNKCYVDLIIDGTHTALATLVNGQNKSVSPKTFFYTFTESDLSTIYNKLTNATKGTIRLTLRTYSDSGYSKEIGGGTYKEITLNIPNDQTTQPTVSMSLSPLSDLPSPYNSLYLQGHSKVKAALEFSTKYGATVVASNITVNGNTYASPYESDILAQAGTVSVKATVKDSRGFYGTYYKEIEVIPYRSPYVSAKSGETSIIAARCDSSANFTDSGTYLKIKAKAVFSKVISNGVQNNYGFIRFRYRKEGGTYSAWQTILDCEKDNSDEVITPPLLNGTLDIKSNYQVQIIASDDLFDSVPITIAVPSDAVYMDKPAGGKSMGLGGYSSGDGNLDIHWKTKARGGLSLFDAKGDEIPLDSTMPLPRDQIKGEWNPDNLECGVHVVANNNALKQGDTVIMYNGVLIQMPGSVGGNVKIQLAFPADTNRNPMYRLCWYNTWADWRSLKL
jgi:hypothetical protein